MPVPLDKGNGGSGNEIGAPPVINRIHKWQPRNYFFVFMLIILTSLVSTNKIHKEFLLQSDASEDDRVLKCDVLKKLNL